MTATRHSLRMFLFVAACLLSAHELFAQSPAVRVARPATDVPAIEFREVSDSRGRGVSVWAEGGAVTPNDLAEALRSGKVRSVYLLECRVTSETMATLKSITTLRRLLVSQCTFTQGDLAVALGNRNLESLSLYFGDSISADVELKPVAELEHLRDLTLVGANISDDGIHGLDGLRKVETIWISSKQVTSRGVVAIASVLKNCEMITLFCPRVDDGIKPVLSELMRADELLLNETAISDACIPSLEKLKQLRHLGIAKTKISSAGAARIRTSLPKAHLIFED